MCSNQKYFTSLVPSSRIIMCEYNTTNLEIRGVEYITGKFSNGMDIILNYIVYVPHLNRQFLSVKKNESANYADIFKNEKVFSE